MVDVGASKLLCQTFGGWSLVEPPTTASPGSLFRCSYSAKGGFDIGDDVSPSHLTADAAQVKHDAQIKNMRV